MRLNKVFIEIICFIYCTVISGPMYGEIGVDQIDSLNKVGWKVYTTDPEKAVILADQQLREARQIHYSKGIINAYYQKGQSYVKMQIFDEATKNYFEALYEVEDSQSPKENAMKLKLFKSIGYAYSKTYGFKTAATYYTQSLMLALEEKDTVEISSLNYNLGIVNKNMHNNELALDYLLISLDFINQDNEDQLSKIYNEIGNVYSFLNDFQSSNSYYRKALHFSTDETKTPYYVSNLGDNFYEQAIYDSAINYYQSALHTSIKYNEVDKINWIQNNLGDVYLKKGDIDQALSFYIKTFNASAENEIDEEYERACKNMAQAYQILGDYQKAFTYNQLYLKQTELIDATKEKLQEQNSIYRMKEMEWELERKAKEKEIAWSNHIIMFLKLASILLTIILTIASYQAIRYYRGIRQVKKWLATE